MYICKLVSKISRNDT